MYWKYTSSYSGLLYSLFYLIYTLFNIYHEYNKKVCNNIPLTLNLRDFCIKSIKFRIERLCLSLNAALNKREYVLKVLAACN